MSHRWNTKNILVDNPAANADEQFILDFTFWI